MDLRVENNTVKRPAESDQMSVVTGIRDCEKDTASDDVGYGDGDVYVGGGRYFEADEQDGDGFAGLSLYLATAMQ
jgi:hypothetical protein